MSPRSIDKFLCSVELHAPSQERRLQNVALFAVVTFDIGREELQIDDEIRDVRYGFTSAQLRLELKDCEMAPQGRYREYISPRLVVTERVSESDSERSADADAKLRVPFLPGLGVSAGVRAGHKQGNKHKITEQNEDAFDRPVVEPHGRYWRFFGARHPQGLLCGQITGDQPLCKIVPATTACSVKACLDVDLHDLWVDTKASPGPLEFNRNAICTLLVAKSLRKSKMSLSRQRRVVSLAEHAIRIDIEEGNLHAPD